MERKSIGTIVLALLVGVLAGCGTMSAGHTGRVEDVRDGQAVLRVNSANAAMTGQGYEVYRYESVPSGNPSKLPFPTQRRETVGCVQVTEVLDARHAKASVVRGHVEARDYALPASSCPLS